jgi:hypothetical protein
MTVAVNGTSTSVAFRVDRDSPVPLYFQLAQQFEAAIRSGALPVGSRLDNEVELARQLGLSRPTESHTQARSSRSLCSLPRAPWCSRLSGSGTPTTSR